ncbi:hypothetical protein POM88_019084 [Heracleum sosnowskyi]|uniref:Uncharacterized protein n=1 Tax=Heracleum sosnowskyi TaxID=360622 RepID=A0AAD8ISJ5_9APIA|nr:hypothetical protein POM88_019084 [Heracleum sosnowskyi]
MIPKLLDLFPTSPSPSVSPPPPPPLNSPGSATHLPLRSTDPPRAADAPPRAAAAPPRAAAAPPRAAAAPPRACMYVFVYECMYVKQDLIGVFCYCIQRSLDLPPRFTALSGVPLRATVVRSASGDRITCIYRYSPDPVRSAAPLLSPAFLSAPLRGTPFRSPLPLSYTLIRSASRGPILCFYRSPAPPRAAPPRAAPPRAAPPRAAPPRAAPPRAAPPRAAPPRAAPPRAAPPRSANPLSATPLSATLVRSASGYPVLCIYIHSPSPPFRPAAPLSAHQNSSKDPSV